MRMFIDNDHAMPTGSETGTATKVDGPAATRRQFLVGSAAGLGLLIGWQAVGGRMAQAAAPTGPYAPNAFVRIGPDNLVTVVAKHFEMGQGTTTGLATLVAEELDADWEHVRTEWAPADASRYNNLNWGPMQGTGGSSAIANSFEQYRKAGAIARDLLVRAAAQEWDVPTAAIRTEASHVVHAPTGKRLPYSALIDRAAKLDPAETVPLKQPADYRLMGRIIPRRDSPAKTDGTAVFAMDVRRPGMLTAVVARPPKFGGKVKSFDAADAMKVKGVTDVVEIPTGIAVLATDTWAAIKGRGALWIDWDLSAAETRSSEAILEEYRALAGKPGTSARADGDVESAFAGAAKTIEAEFSFPYLAHAPMEPLNCTVEMSDGRCDIWAGSQFPTVEQATAAAILGLKPEQVFIHTVYAGGSFGRRATTNADYIAEAATVAKAIGGKAPVHVVWTREDDVQGGYYRPAYVHRIKAAVDDKGEPIAWQQRIVGQSILTGTPFEAFMVKDGVDATSVEGASTLPYAIANLSVDLHTTEVGVPVLWWRSVGHTHTAYSTEIMIDELAEAAGRDPVAFRMALLKDHPRHAGVLKLAAEKAGWGSAVPEGRARGVAVHESFNSYVAEVAEVSLTDGMLKVEKVVCAVDCGQVVNPDVVVAQMQSGIGYGLGAVMRNAIELDGGEVVQTNFPDYEPLRITDMPDVEVYMVDSSEAPTGVGEPGTPPIGPAVANAIRKLTGKAPRNLPFTREGLEFA